MFVMLAKIIAETSEEVEAIVKRAANIVMKYATRGAIIGRTDVAQAAMVITAIIAAIIKVIAVITAITVDVITATTAVAIIVIIALTIVRQLAFIITTVAVISAVTNRSNQLKVKKLHS